MCQVCHHCPTWGHAFLGTGYRLCTNKELQTEKWIYSCFFLNVLWFKGFCNSIWIISNHVLPVTAYILQGSTTIPPVVGLKSEIKWWSRSLWAALTPSVAPSYKVSPETILHSCCDTAFVIWILFNTGLVESRQKGIQADSDSVAPSLSRSLKIMSQSVDRGHPFNTWILCLDHVFTVQNFGLAGLKKHPLCG